MFFPQEVCALAIDVVEAAKKRGVMICTAESCTGGLVCAALTVVPGASAVVLGGMVTYANEAKMELLGVPEALLVQHGAVSETVANAMAEGAELAARHIAPPHAAILSLAVTGVAGPGGGSPEKPVGTIHMAWRMFPAGGHVHVCRLFEGDRDGIRMQSVIAALAGALALIKEAQ